MPKLPAYNSKQIIKVLKKNGFELIRQKGSHKIFENQESGKKITVPFHTKDLPKGTCYAILNQAGII